MNSDGSGSSGDTVTASARAMIITAMRTLSRARFSIPFQNSSRLRTARVSRAKTIWFAAQPMKTKTAVMIETTAHSGSQWNWRHRAKTLLVRSTTNWGMAAA
ncbi:hypothetical protein D3C80_1611900 [compost metagenome]